MIDEALLLLREELVVYLSANGYGSADTIVAIENIGLFESNNPANLDDKIVFTLVNIEEESTLKNAPHIKKNGTPIASYENPPVFLNLYLLVSSCNKASDNGNYVEALHKLSHVIRFFQGKNSFSYSNASFPDNTRPFTNPELINLSIKAELYTLTFEQINHLWGTLGGKQMPSVMYKLRLVAITARKQIREVPLIEEIHTQLVKMPDDC